MSLVSKVVCFVFSALLTISIAHAQIETGTIAGVVKDSTGDVVPNAAVTLTQVATGTTRQTKTSAEGTFNAPFMALGTYSITVSGTGLRTQTLKGITLQVDQTANLTIVLAVGSVSQSVEVTGAAPGRGVGPFTGASVRSIAAGCTGFIQRVDCPVKNPGGACSNVAFSRRRHRPRAGCKSQQLRRYYCPTDGREPVS